MTELVLIYHFQSARSMSEAFIGGQYKVLYLFSPSGPLDHGILTELAKTVPDADHLGLTFSGLEDLKEFALRVAQEFNLSGTRLISVQDYNIGMDSAKDILGFREIFKNFGEAVINGPLKKKKGILGKLFS